MKAGLVLLSSVLCLGSCTALPETPLDHLDLGVYTVTSFHMPHDQRGAMQSAQRLVGQTFIFGPDRIFFPKEFGRPDCQHEGYRLTPRSTAYLQPFDLGEGFTLSAFEAGIEEREILELWNFCVSGVHLSADRGTMYVPGRGALFILSRQ